MRIDLKNKFRRSKLGILWTVVFPLGLSAIMGTVFAIAFHYDILDYMPYVLSGILFWDLVSNTFNAGGFSLIENDSFIRQCRHPLTMYTMKRAIVSSILFLISCIALAIWVVIRNPINILWGILSLPLTMIIYFLFSWAGTTIAGYTCVKYRDYPMMAPLVLQVIWYLSPVFFNESLFQSHPVLHMWFKINPITRMLNLLRKPFLYGCCPNWIDYGECILFVIVLGLIAYRVNKKEEKDLIFYL